jgi:hypothetical protein
MSTPRNSERHVTAESCAQALPTIEPKTYDCIQSNLALLVNAARGAGASLLLGAHLAILPRRLADGLYTVDPELMTEIDRCSHLLNIAADAATATVPAGGLEELVTAATGVCYVVGDAFDMPWLPYFGRAHMPHSFLVAARPGKPTPIVVDAYDNHTEWGAAEPGAWETAWSELSFPAQVWRWRVMKRTASFQTRVERQGVKTYIAAFRTHHDRIRAWAQLAVETWILARRHTLFALAHGSDPFIGPMAGDAAARWERLAADVFLGSRRVRRGRRETHEAIDEVERLLTEPYWAFTPSAPSTSEPAQKQQCWSRHARPGIC